MLYYAQEAIFMQNSAFDKILRQIAEAKQVSSREVREKMQLAMDAAMANPDPSVQAMWQSVPKKGAKPTLDEFMDYLIEKKLLLP